MTPTENPDDKLEHLKELGAGPVDFGSFDLGSFSLDTAKERVNKIVKPVRDLVNRADAKPTDFTGIEKSYGDILDHRTDARVKEKAKQAELDAKYEQLTDYYRVDDGTPFDAQQEEILKQGIPKWMQQKALYEAQESYGEALELEGSPVNARTKSVLDHNLLEAGDSPFEAYESHLNREEHVNAADRRLNTIHPQFSGVEGLSDDEAKIYAVVNLIAENEDVHPDHIYDNLGAYTQQYATMMGVKAVTAMDLHAPMKKGLDTEKTYFDNDTANYKAGMQAAINGALLKDAMSGVTLDDRDDSHSRGIFTAGHAAAVDKYGDKLKLGAKMFELYSDDRTMVTKAMENAGFDNSLAGYTKMLADPSKHATNLIKLALGTNQKRDAEQYAMAEFLASMPREEAKTAMEAAMLIAEANSGEMDDDFVTKFGESLMRGTSKYLYSLEDAITTTSERMGFYSDEEVGTRARVRETLQDLGDIKDIHSAIVSDHKVIQGAYDMAQSAPYMMAYATGAGTTLNALAMLSETDKELRQKYPEMSRTARYKVALPTAVVNANIETLQFKSWTKGFTSFSKGIGKMSPLGVAGLGASRGVAQLVTENIEESAQSASRVYIQHAWSLLGEDVSEVTPEDWDESLFIYDERTFFATLPLAVLGAGGRTAYDTIGAKQNEILLSDVDRMRLFGLSKEKAEAIANQPDAMKKWLMFKDTKETFSTDERNAAIEDAMEDGVLERVLKADDEASFAEYEKDIMENGTDNQKARVEVERTEREYREKFDAQVAEDGEGFKVTYPSVAGKPTAKFKTIEEAEQAVQEHQVETNEEFLEAIGSAAKNLEAMDLHKQSLEVLHKGAEVKLGEDTVTMEEFASQSEENMAQALERIEHELYRMGVPRAATTADLKNWKANGQVHLKREMRGYIAKLGKGANIADLVEEGSEGFVRDLIQNGMVSSKWLKDQIFQFQLDSGKTLTPAKSAAEMTDQQMVEAFSDLAVGNFWNAHSASKTGPMGGIINALRVFFAKVMELADQLAKLSKEGKVDADFQTLLDNSVGLNMDQQIEDNIPKFQQEIVDENDTFSLQQVNKTSANDMADSLGVARTIPEEFVGKKFLPIMADHLGIGDADGVPMQGGAGHPLLYHGTGVGWRSKRGAIAGIYGYLKKRDAIWTDENGHEWALVAPFGMSQDAHKSNKSVFFAYIKSLENTKMSKADKQALGEYIRERADKEVNGTKKKKLNVSRMLSFPLDWTKAQLDELTHDFSHDERAYLMDGLKLAGAKHLNIPDVQTVINQLRDDSYDKVNNGSMLSLLKVDVTRLREGLKKGTENGLDASDFGVDEHLSYDTVLPADIVTHLRQPIDMEVAFPDMIKTMREVSPKSAPSYLLQAKLPAAVELQTLTPELVKEINDEQAGDATPVAKAKAYINALGDKWTTIQTGKLKGAANFIAAMERNEFSETLTPINMESLKADVKSGDLSVYGLEGFDVWFGLRKREDGGKELVNVISNELSTGGMIDLIMMKAIKEGATHLDAYSVKSKKFPSGLLPTLYGRYGFKVTSEDAYDKNYLGSTAKARNTKEKALKELWAKQGWDSSGQDMPSLVYMRYEPTPATEQLRQNAQDSMVERSIEELRGETIQPSEGNGDVSGSRVDGGESGGDAGGDRGALSRRANSFLDELGSASSARLAAWNLTESERDQLVEASTPSFSIAPILETLEPTNQEEQQAFDKASKFQDRNPYLAVASNRLRNKVISRAEFRAIVDEVDPFTVKGVEDIPSLENIAKFLIKSKADKLGKEVETGETVELRIDIPTYNASIKEDFNSPVYAVTLHEKSNSKDKAGSVLSYQPAAHVKNPEFFARPTAKAADKKVGALSIAEGGGKFPLATVRGELVTTDPTSLPSKEELQGWAEVGYNPTRSSEFRDVKSGQIVSGGSESVSIGSRVYVKNPTYKTEDSLGEFGGKNISFSLTSSEDSVIDKLNAMMRDQETRIEVYRNMSARLNKVRQRIHTNKHSSDFVTQNLAEMEAIVSVLPPELRHRAFSAKTLASKKTGEGASRYMVERLEYIDKILERFLKGELTESVVKAINQSQPLPRGGGDRGPSKIGALGHRVAAAAKEAIFMSPMEAEAASKLVLESLNKKVEPTVEEEQMVHDVAYVYEVFADIKNADSTRLSTMLDLMQTNWEKGRSKWLGELKKRKEWKEDKVASILRGLDMVEKDDAATHKAQQKGLRWYQQFGRSLLSIYQLTDVLREDMGKEGKVIKEMIDDLRKAQSRFDMEQLHHKERMRDQFAKIFGIKGTNKVARVQARLNSIAKGVDRGDKLTTSKMYDFNVKVWGADLDKAKAQLQVTPDAKEVVVGGIPLTRDEFDEVYEAYTLDVEAGFFDANKKNRKYSALVQRQTGERWNVGEKSQLDLANDFLAMQQADLKGKYQKTGHDEQYERELNEALDDDVKELAMWMQNELRILTPQTEKLHTEEYGLFMATVENYFPASFEHASKSGDTALTMDGIDVAGVSTRPSAHKMRINHHSRPVRTNAVNAFNHHVMQNAYWKTHAEVLRKWGGVMRNKDVQDGILRAKGKGFLDQLLNQFEDIETQGSKVAASQIAADRLWRGLTKGVALGVLGGRMTTVAKNMAATFNVALGEDIGTLLKGVDPTEFKEATKELWYSDTFQRRLKMGANVATRYALEGSRSGAIIPATATRMAEMSMQLINVADTGSNMAMSLAYIAKKKELRQQNKYKEEEIKLIALDHVDDLMERYAQPTNRLSKSLMENTRHPMAQILVMFQSESRKMMAINALAIRKLATGKGAQSKGLAAQQLAVQVVLMTGFIHTISAAYDAFIKGEGEGEEEGEKFFANFTDWKKLLATMAADSLSGVPLFGELWSTTWKSLFDQKTFVSSSNPALKPILGLQAFIKGAEQAGENSASETADKFFRSLQAMGGIMPQTAVVAQASTLAKDALGFMNNSLATGLTKADTFDVYRKKIKGVISRTGKEFEEEMEAVETLGEKRILEAERKQLILERSRVILFNIPEDERQEFLREQAGSEKSGTIPKYIIRSYLK